jgi:hypothetical protein
MIILPSIPALGWSGWRVQSGIRSRTRNLVQGIGDGPNQIFHTVASDGRNRMELELPALAEIAKSVEPHCVGGGVQFGGNEDHRFFDERRAKCFKLAVDDFERMDRIIGVGVAGVDQMDEEACTFDVSEKTDAEASA